MPPGKWDRQDAAYPAGLVARWQLPPNAPSKSEPAVAASRARKFLPLPHGVIGILNGKRGRGRGVAAREAFIAGKQFTNEHTDGPPVANDMVQDHYKDVLVLGTTKKLGAPQRFVDQIERAPCLTDCFFPRSFHACRWRNIVEAYRRQLRRSK